MAAHGDTPDRKVFGQSQDTFKMPHTCFAFLAIWSL